jgi:hypothetical protein
MTEEHKKCPHIEDCPWYNPKFKICSELSGIYGNQTATCWIAYERWKQKERLKK